MYLVMSDCVCVSHMLLSKKLHFIYCLLYSCLKGPKCDWRLNHSSTIMGIPTHVSKLSLIATVILFPEKCKEPGIVGLYAREEGLYTWEAWLYIRESWLWSYILEEHGYMQDMQGYMAESTIWTAASMHFAWTNNVLLTFYKYFWKAV